MVNCYRLQFIIDEQLWCHHYESKSEEEAIRHVDEKRIPTVVFLVEE
jgi:hypothetical protein